MMISRNALKLAIFPVLLMGSLVLPWHTRIVRKLQAPNPVVTYTVNTYEDNQDFCAAMWRVISRSVLMPMWCRSIRPK